MSFVDQQYLTIMNLSKLCAFSRYTHLQLTSNNILTKNIKNGYQYGARGLHFTFVPDKKSENTGNYVLLYLILQRIS